MTSVPLRSVVIPKGTVVYSSLPAWPREGKPLTRDQTVKPYRGRVAVYGDVVHVTWAGTGGYWKRTILPAPLVEGES